MDSFTFHPGIFYSDVISHFTPGIDATDKTLIWKKWTGNDDRNHRL